LSGSRKRLPEPHRRLDLVNASLDVPKQGADFLIRELADKLESAVIRTRWTAEAMLESSQARLSGLVDGSLSAVETTIDAIEPVVWSLAQDATTLGVGLIDSAAGQIRAQVEHLLEEVR